MISFKSPINSPVLQSITINIALEAWEVRKVHVVSRKQQQES